VIRVKSPNNDVSGILPGWADARRNKEEAFMATPVTVPMVGKIVSVSVKVGDKVKEDDQVAVMEAMKMEMPLVAPVNGVIKEIRVSPGQEVEAEATIAVIE
jgi:acetyl-CoA carboxylase biotin carboxyl carrier protein